MVNPGDGHDEAQRAAEPPQPQTYVPQPLYTPPQPAAPPPQSITPVPPPQSITPVPPPPPITPVQPMTQYPVASRALTAPPPVQPAGAAPVTVPGVSAEELARALEQVEKSK